MSAVASPEQKNGKLVVMVGGTTNVIEKLKPVSDVLYAVWFIALHGPLAKRPSSMRLCNAPTLEHKARCTVRQ